MILIWWRHDQFRPCLRVAGILCTTEPFPQLCSPGQSTQQFRRGHETMTYAFSSFVVTLLLPVNIGNDIFCRRA